MVYMVSIEPARADVYFPDFMRPSALGSHRWTRHGTLRDDRAGTGRAGQRGGLSVGETRPQCARARPLFAAAPVRLDPRRHAHHASGDWRGGGIHAARAALAPAMAADRAGDRQGPAQLLR